MVDDADLRSANLQKAKLEGTNLRGAKFDANTSWPSSFNPAARGGIEVECAKLTPSQW
jgi:uncharacterized protein YjbI with pentapeptide repeats